jgi:hypothetical protein
MKIPVLAPIGDNLTPDIFTEGVFDFTYWPKQKYPHKRQPMLRFGLSPDGTHVGIQITKGSWGRGNKLSVLLFENDRPWGGQTVGTYSDTAKIPDPKLRSRVEFGLEAWAAEVARRDQKKKDAYKRTIERL